MKKIRFEISDLLPIGLTLVVVGIALAYGLNVLADTQDTIGDDSCADRADGLTGYNSDTNLCYNATHTGVVGTAEYNASADTITGVSKLPEKLPLIVTVIVAAVIIGILVRYLMVRFN